MDDDFIVQLIVCDRQISPLTDTAVSLVLALSLRAAGLGIVLHRVMIIRQCFTHEVNFVQ